MPSTLASDDAFYMCGSVNNKITIFKLRASDGTHRWTYSIRDTAGVSTTVKMTRLDSVMGAVTMQHMGCAENLGSDMNDIAFILMTETLGLIPSVTQTWYIDTNIKFHCVSIDITSSSTA